MHNPPSTPDTVHTPFYCEENIYLLCEAFVLQQEEVSAVFISNEQKTVALWNQKLNDESVVVWDYHVFLLLRSRGQQHWIYDFDSRLPFPCLMRDYLRHTFKENVAEPYRSLFRIVPGSTFVEHFASDRSHMLVEAGEYDAQNVAPKRYRSPPPSHPPIRGRNATTGNNLMESFVGMASSAFGKVLDLQGVVRLAEE
ncbi:N-terminal glutamine amidase-domain-containing protein [Mycena alexandri]|uniref:Protein N-terminal glutamine amidohydrolase n=1 Tax=Mycena alexandri TaxID=1745969 RepID=A0AAD6TMP6_9AGAR|nr:N-terminal glutamine amidase-domain-containing protein [Mycena alexandri]